MTVLIKLRCPRCKKVKTVTVDWRVRMRQAAGKLPPDTRCQPCWNDGWTNISMSIVGAKAYPKGEA